MPSTFPDHQENFFRNQPKSILKIHLWSANALLNHPKNRLKKLVGYTHKKEVLLV